MKERLIELIREAHDIEELGMPIDVDAYIADHLLENGVIVPPCKVGQTVYAVSNNKVYKTRVFSMVAETEDKKWVYILKCNIFDGISMFKTFLFGKTVFLTKEEAEQKLRKEDEGK